VTREGDIDAPANAGLSAGAGASSLSIRGVKRYFGDTHALDGIDLRIPSGEITALVGHNGAGKSALLKILSGADLPDSGEIYIDDKEVSFRGPSDALEHGISSVYQELSLVSQLSVVQNMFLGHETGEGSWLDQKAMIRRAKELCGEFGVAVDVRTPLGQLTVAQRQLVEVATAVNRNSRFLLLDEPTSALEARQITRLLDTVRMIAMERSVGVLLVDHKLDEVFRYSQRIFVIANGKRILEGTAESLTRQAVVDAIVGSHFEEHRYLSTSNDTIASLHPAVPVRSSSPKTVFSATKLSTDRLSGIDLTVQSGEVVGLYGLMGSGRSSFLRTIVGLYPVRSGAMTLDGVKYSPSNVRDSLHHKVAYVSEERKVDGIIPNLGIFQNVGIAVLGDYSTTGFIHQTGLIEAAKNQLASMRTHGDLSKGITALSGGNQQKALLARAFLQHPRLLLLDEPTKGVDIGAKAEIHGLIRQLAEETGAGILVVTSEEEEALSLTDTLNVFQGGTCTAHDVPTHTLSIARLKSLAWLESSGGSSEVGGGSA